MVKALQIAIDKKAVNDSGDTAAIATWIKSFDKLLANYNVMHVAWEAVESDGKLVFSAWVPADCLPEFENAADFIKRSVCAV